VSDELVQILDGNTFVVSDDRGDISASLTDPTGLFSYDTRFLSKWILTVDGQHLNTLSVDDLNYFETRFFLVPGTGTVYVDSKLSVIRQRAVGEGFEEQLTILNHDEEPVDLHVRIDAAADFADLFEVKDALTKKGSYTTRMDNGSLVLAYDRETFARWTTISSSAPAELDADGLSFDVHLEPHGEWTTDLQVVAGGLGIGAGASRAHVEGARSRAVGGGGAAARVRLGAAEGDLPPEPRRPRRAALLPADRRGRSLPAAGLPWFMTMFGRDSIFTSLQALPFTPELAATTLRALAMAGHARRRLPGRGSRPDPARAALRRADGVRGAPALAVLRCGRRDAALRRPARRVRALDRRPQARARPRVRGRAALRWIDEYADLQGNGYIWYQRRNEETGLENQCWKDSWDSISYRDGGCPVSRARRASCRGTRTTRSCAARGSRATSGRTRVREELERQAADLKRRFNRDFWVEDGEYFALALDAEGKQVDALASNNGHLLWSGIVDKSKAKAVARHLLGPRLFSGWGVRTLAEGEARYNPIGYHVGTVWPFDNSFIAWGLRATASRRRRRDRGRDPRRREFFEGACRGVRRLRARADEVPGAVPDGVQPAGVVDRGAAAAAADDARARAVGEHLVVDPALPAGSATSSCSTSPGAGAGSTHSRGGACACARSRARRRSARTRSLGCARAPRDEARRVAAAAGRRRRASRARCRQSPRPGALGRRTARRGPRLRRSRCPARPPPRAYERARRRRHRA
jgi:glycogen debranching enzyme